MKTLESYDYWAAAYLMAVGIELVETRPGRFPRFVFNDAQGVAREALKEWRTGQALVPARVYADAIREAKRMAFDATR